jgi:hypothetical protein
MNIILINLSLVKLEEYSQICIKIPHLGETQNGLLRHVTTYRKAFEKINILCISCISYSFD